jgi:hypothetical protein
VGAFSFAELRCFSAELMCGCPGKGGGSLASPEVATKRREADSRMVVMIDGSFMREERVNV